MNGEIIQVGTELMGENISNAHAGFLLSELGIALKNNSVVENTALNISEAFKTALGRSDVIILIGGIGYSQSDITKQTIADILGLELYADSELLYEMIDYYVSKKETVPTGIERQALCFADAKIFKNNLGTAPGFCIEINDKHIILLPQNTNELEAMFQNYVAPYLKPFAKQYVETKILHIFGVTESEVKSGLGNILKNNNPEITVYSRKVDVAVRIVASAKNEDLAKELMETAVKRIKKLFENKVYSDNGETMSETAVKLLLEKGLKVSTAESCTAGMLSKNITDVSGSSSVFEMGVSAYSNSVKIKTLSVPEELIEEKGAVSPETAVLMAKGIQELSEADLGIGITGVAGPLPSEGNPVGLVFIGMTDGKNAWVRKMFAEGETDRDAVRKQATISALDMIRRYALSDEGNLGGGFLLGEDVVVCNYPDDFLPSKKTISPLSMENIKEKIKVGKELEDLFIESDEDNNLEEPEKMSQEDLQKIEEKDENKEFFDDLMSAVMSDVREMPKDLNCYYDTGSGGSEDFFIDDDEELIEIKKKNKKTNRKIISLILVVAIVLSAFWCFNFFNAENVHKRLVAEQLENYDMYSTAINDEGFPKRFEELKKQNEDIKGWLKIDGTEINYPFYQTKNNDFYKNHDMSKSQNRYGAIFADKGAKINKKEMSRNIVLHGNNMEDENMFSQLVKYKNLDFYKKSPIITLDTIYSNPTTYKVFAVFVINTDKKQDDGYLFNYRQNYFPTDKNFGFFIDNVMARSIIKTNVEIGETDSILTLSTDSDEFENAKTVVMARKLREGESKYVNTATAKKNKKPLYPQAYYDKHGGKKPKVKIEYYVGNPDATEQQTSGGNETGKIDENTEMVVVPALSGVRLIDAIEKLNKVGLYISSIEYKPADVLASVVGQGIAPGTMVAKNSGIKLVVKGNEYETNVPKLKGLSAEEVIETATKYHLTLRITEKPSKKEKGTVLSQGLEAGSSTRQRFIDITVASGENKVPSVVGLKTKDARKALEKAGFTVLIVKVETDNKDEIGKVVSQSVDAEKLAELKNPITIQVGMKKEDKKDESSSSNKSSSSSSSSKKEESSSSNKSSSSSSSSKKEESTPEDTTPPTDEENKDPQGPENTTP